MPTGSRKPQIHKCISSIMDSVYDENGYVSENSMNLYQNKNYNTNKATFVMIGKNVQWIHIKIKITTQIQRHLRWLVKNVEYSTNNSGMCFFDEGNSFLSQVNMYNKGCSVFTMGVNGSTKLLVVPTLTCLSLNSL